jgi:hypothetical protein
MDLPNYQKRQQAVQEDWLLSLTSDECRDRFQAVWARVVAPRGNLGFYPPELELLSRLHPDRLIREEATELLQRPQ